MYSLFHSIPEAQTIWQFYAQYEQALLSADSKKKADALAVLTTQANNDPTLKHVVQACRLDAAQRTLLMACLYTTATLLQKALETRGEDDGTAMQTLTETTVTDLFANLEDQYGSVYHRQLADYCLPLSTLQKAIWTAIIVHGLSSPDAPWSINQNGDVERVLRTDNPLRGRAHTMKPLAMELPYGDSVHVVAWCMVPEAVQTAEDARDSLGFLTVVGSAKKNRAAWAVLVDGKSHRLRLPQKPFDALSILGRNTKAFYGSERVTTTNAQRFLGNQQYGVFNNDTPLPISQGATTAIIYRPSIYPRPSVDFLHVTGMDEKPNLALFWKQLDIACPLPLRAEWVQQLWELGINHQAILPVPSWGCQGYWVHTDTSKWSRIIRIILTGSDDPQDDIVTIDGADKQASELRSTSTDLETFTRSESDDDDND